MSIARYWPQWFDKTGTCKCGKPATGILRNNANSPCGAYCEKCANKEITRSKYERAQSDYNKTGS